MNELIKNELFFKKGQKPDEQTRSVGRNSEDKESEEALNESQPDVREGTSRLTPGVPTKKRKV